MSDLNERARAAAAGDRQAVEEVLSAIQDQVYALSLRMLGHPADAEDAAQEILVIVLTHLGSFRGESALRTWVFRIAANHLSRVKRGQRETVTFEVLEDCLRSGLGDGDPESEALTRELRLRCTQAMLVCLDRETRIACVLADVFGLSNDEGAEVLELDAATYRKRVSRARERLYAFMHSWCGVYAEANPCRCARQVGKMCERGLLASDDSYLSAQRSLPLERAAEEVGTLSRVTEVIRGAGSVGAPASVASRIRELIASRQFVILNH